MRISSLFVALLFAAVTFSLWALINRPTEVVAWPEEISGYAFSPFRQGQDALINVMPSTEEIRQDIALLAGNARALRTYSSLRSLADIPAIADQHDMKVTLGIWLGLDPQINQDEMVGGVALANTYDNITSVMVGNETVLRGEFTAEEMSVLLARVKSQVSQPVSTAEPWHVWLRYPELADNVDFLTVHMLPYWEGVHVDVAVDYIVDRMKQLEEAFPDKPILIGEVGWPSSGRTREAAVAGAANEALFLRRFLHRAEQENYEYFLMEAFDQPWKAQSEGGVGAYWGVYDVQRKPKFSFDDPIVRVPGWHVLAAISILSSIIMLGFFFVNSETLKTKGHGLIALVSSATATVLVWIIYDYSQQYMTVTSVVVGVLLVIGMLGVVTILLTEAHEWAEAHWFTVRRRQIKPTQLDMASVPKVSIHVPAYNEPAEMMIETLNALARLDYPDFEVLVIDNNTRDEAVWRPVEEHCAKLGERFRFFHVAPLSGFKAGALNFALARTHKDAVVIAAIDSDYQVEPNWLRDLVGAFENPKMAIVQSPQDYRDHDDSAFKSMCFAEYRGFFEIGMITRNERNAIIQHGTMTLVRRSVLDDLGGWAEWCITEDAELGLRIFEAGYEAMYLSYSYGRGLMPDTFIDYKKQRFRWAYGAMQILRRHTAELFSSKGSSLTNGQRYHFLAGWLPWVADGFNLIFNLAAIAWSIAMIMSPTQIDAPLVMFSVLPLSLFAFKISKMVYLYRSRVKANLRQTIAAAVAGLALSHTVGLATLKGLFTDNMPFVRTPKCARPSAVLQALTAVREELLMLIILCLVVLMLSLVPREYGSPDLRVWSIVLMIQAIPYAAAVLVSFISTFRWPARLLGGGIKRKLYIRST
ncbi:MAG: glycosyltransferase [Gammaproteobacteria bacterium]|nr:glycosyltransferase [Gammaproteobacteria bacterium]MDP2139412.1 glycosyltransferase [Gammaproteobacteria bacterium]MDP2346248.1 glycosyltransferase [Gammaproteobacteria bacterium]